MSIAALLLATRIPPHNQHTDCKSLPVPFREDCLPEPVEYQPPSTITKKQKEPTLHFKGHTGTIDLRTPFPLSFPGLASPAFSTLLPDATAIFHTSSCSFIIWQCQ